MDNIQPDSSPLPHFEWTDSEGTLRPIATTVDDPAPRKITEYHINPVNWVTLERYTPDEILSPESAHVVCKVCNGGLYKDGKSNRGVPPCPGTPCVETFRREACEPAEKLVEIRETARMGLGVFAKVDIPRGTWLGEYLGELFPYDAEVFPLDGDMYVFNIQQTAQCSARQFGNWTVRSLSFFLRLPLRYQQKDTLLTLSLAAFHKPFLHPQRIQPRRNVRPPRRRPLPRRLRHNRRRATVHFVWPRLLYGQRYSVHLWCFSQCASLASRRDSPNILSRR